MPCFAYTVIPKNKDKAVADNSFTVTLSNSINAQGSNFDVDFLETGAFWDMLEKNADISASTARLLRLCVVAGFHHRVSAAGSRTDLLLIARDLQKDFFIAPDPAEAILTLLVSLLRPNNPELLPDTGPVYSSGIEDLHQLPPPGNAAPEDAFLFVKGKSFMMGKPGGSGYDHLKPHKVTVGSFYICKFPVRQNDYYQIMQFNPSYRIGAALPVTGVSWYNAVDYCNKRSIIDELQPAYRIDTMPDPQNILAFDANKWTVTCNAEADGYRLPTDAEWECAYSLFQTDEYTREWCGDLWPVKINSYPQFERTYHKPREAWDKSCECPSGVGGGPYIGSLGFRLARTAYEQ